MREDWIGQSARILKRPRRDGPRAGVLAEQSACAALYSGHRPRLISLLKLSLSTHRSSLESSSARRAALEGGMRLPARPMGGMRRSKFPRRFIPAEFWSLAKTRLSIWAPHLNQGWELLRAPPLIQEGARGRAGVVTSSHNAARCRLKCRAQTPAETSMPGAIPALRPLVRARPIVEGASSSSCCKIRFMIVNIAKSMH